MDPSFRLAGVLWLGYAALLAFTETGRSPSLVFASLLLLAAIVAYGWALLRFDVRLNEARGRLAYPLGAYVVVGVVAVAVDTVLGALYLNNSLFSMLAVGNAVLAFGLYGALCFVEAVPSRAVGRFLVVTAVLLAGAGYSTGWMQAVLVGAAGVTSLTVAYLA